MSQSLPEIRAYRIPYSTYRLWLCLRCARPYPDGPDKEPVRVIPWLTACDRCHVKIPMTEER